jgi:ribosome-binding protein aMBF1 (putative translation factor)
VIKPHQIRAGRAMIGWSQDRLAKESGLSVLTVKRMEAPDGTGKRLAENVDAVQRALESGGVEFTSEAGVQPKKEGDMPGEK